MKKISSNTFIHKRLFPAAFFGVLIFILVEALIKEVPGSPVFLMPVAFVALIGFFVMKKCVWVLVDEVYDCGDYLLVRNRGLEERIELSNIMNVNASIFMNPPQITLRLINPGRNGNEITFSPATPAGFVLNPFAKNAIAEDLIMRAHHAKTGAR
jgi:hypothetical protein